MAAERKRTLSKGAAWGIALGIPAAVFAAYQLAALALMTPVRHQEEVDGWRASHEQAVTVRLGAAQAQMEEVQAEAKAAAATSIDTNQKVDSLVCSLLQKGKPVGGACILPSGVRRTLGPP